MAEKRKYTKRSEYWNKFGKENNHNLNKIFDQNSEASVEPELVGESLYESVASRLQPSQRTTSRKNNIAGTFVKDRFKFTKNL